MFDCQALIFGDAELPLLVLAGEIPLELGEATAIELVLTLRGVGVVDLRAGGEGLFGGGDGRRKGVESRKLGVGLE